MSMWARFWNGLVERMLLRVVTEQAMQSLLWKQCGSMNTFIE